MALLLLGVFAGTIYCILRAIDFYAAEKRRALERAAQSLGLLPCFWESWDHTADFSFAGTVEGIPVRIGQHTESDGESSTDWLLLSAEIPGAPTLCFGRVEPGMARFRSSVLGDARFDACLAIESDEAEALAVLNAHVCHALGALREREGQHEGAMVESGMLRVKAQSSLTVDNLESWVRRGVEVARALALPSVLEERLAQHAETSPHDEVACRNLEVLARRFPGRPTTLAALQRGLASSRLSLRLLAAKLLEGEEAHQVLSALVRAHPNQVPDDLRVEALEVLIRRRPAAELQSLIAGALAESPSPLRAAAIHAVGELGDYSHCDALQTLLPTGDLKEGLALVSALKSLPGPRSETLLCQLIHRNPDNNVRRRAAEVLGMQGTLASVSVLYPLSKALLPHGGLTAAARDAIRAIQARAEGGARGELQLSASDAGIGALSPSSDVGALASAGPGRSGLR